MGWKEVSINLDLNESEYVETINFGRFTGDLSEENNLHIGDYFYVDWVKAYVPMNVENGNITQTLDSSEYNDVFMFEFVSNSSEFDYFTNVEGDTCDFTEDIENWQDTVNFFKSITIENGVNTLITNYGISNTYVYYEINGLTIDSRIYNIFQIRLRSNITWGDDYSYSFQIYDGHWGNLINKYTSPILANEWTIITLDLSQSNKWTGIETSLFILWQDSPNIIPEDVKIEIDYIKLLRSDYPLKSLSNSELNVTLSDDSGYSQLINQEILNNHFNYTWGNSSHYETISQFAISKMLFQLKYGFYPTKVSISMSVNSSLYLLRLGEYYIYGENTYTLIDLGYTYTFIPNYNLFFDYSDIKGNNKKFDLDFTDLYYLDNLGNKTKYQKYKHQFISFKGYPSSNKLLFILDEFYNIDNLEKGFWTIYFNYTQDLEIECVDNEFNSYITWNFLNNGSLLINNYATLTNSLVVRTNLTDTWLTLEQISFGYVYMFKHSLSGQTSFAGKYFTNITMGDYSQWHNVPLINNSISGFHDYAQEVLGDAWDFEEGDTEKSFTNGQATNIIVKNGYIQYDAFDDWDGIKFTDYTGWGNKFAIDTSYYNFLIMRAKANVSYSNYWFFWLGYNSQAQIAIYSSDSWADISLYDEWHTYIIDLRKDNNYKGQIIDEIRIHATSGSSNAQIQIDFIRLIHLDGLRFYHEDKNFGDLIDFNEANSDADHIMVSGSTTGYINDNGYALFSSTNIIKLYFWDDPIDNLTHIQLLDKNISLLQTRVFIEDTSTDFWLYTQSDDHLYAYSYISSLKKGWNVITLPIPYMTYLKPESIWYIRIDTTNCIIDYIYTFNYETEYTYIKTDKELSLNKETIIPVEEVEQVFSSSKSNIIYTKLFEEEKENYLTLNITYDIYLDKSDSYIKYSSEEELNLTYNSLNIRKYILLNNLLEKSSSEYTNYTYTLKKIYLEEFTDLRGNLTFYSGLTNQSQTLTYERAYNGLYAYKNEVSNCLEFKTVIDIPHVSYFPRKITFYSYSTNYKYELRFYI
ncbi:MAG: hypothetical protein ACTSPQ_20575, partial [Candidatus Helarchaeota archaeon]